MDVRVCQRKCDLKDGCKEFESFSKSEQRDASIQSRVESQSSDL
jgi:hypothetical protein